MFDEQTIEKVVRKVFSEKHFAFNIDVYPNAAMVAGSWNETCSQCQCFQFMLYESTMEIESVKYPNEYNCPIRGKLLLEKLIYVAYLLNVHEITLLDMSAIHHHETKSFSLLHYRLLKGFPPWYTTFGFEPLSIHEYNHMMQKVEVLQTIPLDELNIPVAMLSNVPVSLSPMDTVKEVLSLLDERDTDQLSVIDFIINSPKLKFSPLREYKMQLTPQKRLSGGTFRRRKALRTKRPRSTKRQTKRLCIKK
jgi:hypothetical protein